MPIITWSGNFLSWTLLQKELVWVCLLLLTDFYQTVFVYAFLSSLPLPSPFNFSSENLPEKVNEIVPSLLLSCSGHAWMRMLLHMNIGLLWSNDSSLLSRSCVWHVLCLFLLLYLSSELPLQVCPRLDFSLWNEILGFSARDVFGPATSICNSRISCRRMSSLERRLATHVSMLPKNQLENCADSLLSVGLSATAEGSSSVFVSKAWTLSFFMEHSINLWSPRWLPCRHLS